LLRRALQSRSLKTNLSLGLNQPRLCVEATKFGM